MANNPKIKQITLPSNSTYDIADPYRKVWFGTCNTANSTTTKIVKTTGEDFYGHNGDIIFIKFSANNTGTNSITLQIDGKSYWISGSDSRKSLWDEGEIKIYVIDTLSTAAEEAIDYGIDGVAIPAFNTASLYNYGLTKLTNTISSDQTTATTPKAVKDYVATQISGAAAFQGSVTMGTASSGQVSNDPQLTGSAYVGGYYWVVTEAGLYPVTEQLSEYCEVGDFIFCISPKGQVYNPADFAVLQANIDMNRFGDLAFADTASDTYTPAGTVSKPTFTGTQATITTKTSSAVTAISANTTSTNGVDITPKGTISSKTPGSGETANYTPAGTISGLTFTGTSAQPAFEADEQFVQDVSLEKSTSGGTGWIEMPITATLGQPTVTVTPSTTTKYVASSTTGGGSVTAGTAASCTMPTYNVSNENLTISAGSFTANTPTAVTLPSFTSQTIATGISSATATAPSFSNARAPYLKLNVTKDAVSGTFHYTPSGTISQPTFSGTGTLLEFTGEPLYLHTTKSEISATGTYTPAGDVSKPTFSGTEATITVEPDQRS